MNSLLNESGPLFVTGRSLRKALAVSVGGLLGVAGSPTSC